MSVDQQESFLILLTMKPLIQLNLSIVNGMVLGPLMN